MTTIAYRSGVLAADTGTTVGGTRIGDTSKIGRAVDGSLYGAAGRSTYASAFREWAHDMRCGTPPEAIVDGNYCDRGLIVYPDGRIEIYEQGGKFTVAAPYYAMGSGRCEALGAMHAGGDAEAAIRAAMAHDESTYGHIESVAHE